jgi:O-antigen/teichoic acid export membrane protein
MERLIIYLENKFERTIHQSLLNVTGKVLGLIITAGFLIYISRMLSIKEMGIFAILNTLAAPLFVISGLGLTVTAVRVLPEYLALGDKVKEASIISTTLFSSLLTLGSAVFIAFLFRSFLSEHLLKSTQYSDFIALALLYSFFSFFSDAFLLINRGLRRFDFVFRIHLLNTFSQRFLGLMFYFAGLSLKGIFIGFILGAVVSAFYGYYNLRDRIRFKNIDLAVVRYSQLYYLREYARYAFSAADQVIVALFFNPQILGAYYITKRLVSSVNMVLDGVREPMLARLIQLKNEPYYNKFFLRFAVFFIGGAAVFCIVFLLFSDTLLAWFASRKYIEFTNLVRLFSILLIFYAVYNMVSTHLFIRYAPKYVLYNFLFLATFVIIFEILGGYFGSYKGVIIGQIFGYSLVSGFTIFWFKRARSYKNKK